MFGNVSDVFGVGMKRFKQADEYLSLAKWAVLKSPDCSAAIRAQLYRNFGMLYAAQDKNDEALRQLANDVGPVLVSRRLVP